MEVDDGVAHESFVVLGELAAVGDLLERHTQRRLGTTLCEPLKEILHDAELGLDDGDALETGPMVDGTMARCGEEGGDFCATEGGMGDHGERSGERGHVVAGADGIPDAEMCHAGEAGCVRAVMDHVRRQRLGGPAGDEGEMAQVWCDKGDQDVLQSGHVDVAGIQAEGAQVGEGDAVGQETEVAEAAPGAVEGETGQPGRRKQDVTQGKGEGGHAGGPLSVVCDEGEGGEGEGGDDVGDVDGAEVEMGEAGTGLGGDPGGPGNHARLVLVGLDVDALDARGGHAVELVEHALERRRGEPADVDAAPAPGVAGERGDERQEMPPCAGDAEPALAHREGADRDGEGHVAAVDEVALHHGLCPPGGDAEVGPQTGGVGDDAPPALADTQPLPAGVDAGGAVERRRVLEDGDEGLVGEPVHERTLGGVHELVEGALDAGSGVADDGELVQKRGLPVLETAELRPERGCLVGSVHGDLDNPGTRGNARKK